MNWSALPLILFSAVSLTAQRRQREWECPYADPKLTAMEAEEVAWAACELPLAAADRNGQIADLRRALRTWRQDDSPTGRIAHGHLLRALAQRDAVLSPEELTVPDDPALRAVATMLLLELPDDGPLFFAFRQRQATEVEWEVLGGALALRRHVPFAAELFTAWQPCLRLEVVRSSNQRSTEVRSVALPRPEPGRMPPLRVGWARDDRGILAPEFGWPGSTSVACLTERDSGRARLRWLAYLAGEPDPRTFVAGFDTILLERDQADYRGRLARARERSEKCVERIAMVFRERHWIPPTRKAPALTVEVLDLRSPDARNASPLPAIEGITVTMPPPVASPTKTER
ncbi:MAG: hypothetical protein IPK26_03510 [Planctomycetes bacterium]|nr:hypothetical protein [Planctomycetota bacterium]